MTLFRNHARLLAVAFSLIALLLVACSGGESASSSSSSASTEEAITQATEEQQAAAAQQEATAAPTEQAAAPAPANTAYNGPDWANIQLTNARTGETFTFADFAGKTVYVHPMATWCTNCRSSLRVIRDEVLPQINAEDFVIVSLSVDLNDSTQAMAAYAEANQFEWVLGVVSPEMLTAWTAQFGSSVANPPVRPHFIVRPAGSTTALMTGNTPAEDTIADLLAASQG